MNFSVGSKQTEIAGFPPSHIIISYNDGAQIKFRELLMTSNGFSSDANYVYYFIDTYAT